MMASDLGRPNHGSNHGPKSGGPGHASQINEGPGEKRTLPCMLAGRRPRPSPARSRYHTNSTCIQSFSVSRADASTPWLYSAYLSMKLTFFTFAASEAFHSEP